MDPLYTLDPEGFLLHAGMHASAHLFAYGLKTVWDLLWALFQKKIDAFQYHSHGDLYAISIELVHKVVSRHSRDGFVAASLLRRISDRLVQA
jgi:hypothetical protein